MTIKLSFYLLTLLCLAALPGVAQDATNDLVKRAEASYQAKHFAESAALYLQALPLVEDRDRGGVEYNLACTQALAGERNAAFITLEQAVEDGYTNRKGTETDQDLVTLHTDARWQQLLERMTTFNAQQDARWGDAAFATPYTANIPDADKLAGLSVLWAQAKFGFANFWHVPKLDWDRTYRDFIPKVLATYSTVDYYRVLQSFYALLQDGHSGVYDPQLVNGTVDRLPIRTRLIDGHMLVVGSRDSSANLQGIQPGDEIAAINSEPTLTWIDKNVTPLVSASTTQDRNERIYKYVPFLAPIGTAFTLRVETPTGTQSTYQFVVTDSPARHRALFEYKILPDNIAYVALNGFDDDTAIKEWDKRWPEISKARAIVLDLRENGGGSDTVGNHILATLIDKPAPGLLSQSTRWIATYRAWGTAETYLRYPVNTINPDPVHHFSGPVVLLTSPRTYSAGEDMTVAFTQAHRGKIIGEPTGGSTGQPLLFKLPGGGTARICTKHDSFADGREFVGIGIQPDVPIHVTRADIVSNHDTVLEAAIRSLQPSRSR